MSTVNYKELIGQMFELQDSFNQVVHPEWRDQHYAWDHAIWVECAEMMEHLGYKWWKHQEMNHEQVVLEMVDIWHFGMSFIMANDQSDHHNTTLLDYVTDNITSVEEDYTIMDASEIRYRITSLVGHITDEVDYCFDLYEFFTVWYGLGKTITDLYTMYVGKNALNKFRQANGYKDGTYIKIWNGREDNEYLTDILKAVPIDADLMRRVLEELNIGYAAIKNS